MAEDAIAELRSMPKTKRKTERYNELLLATLMMQQSWAEAADTAQWLCGKNEKETAYFIHAAYCMHETGDTLAALRFLMNGPKSLLDEPLYHYNMACYHAMLDQPEPALYALRRSFELDPELREVAENDEDLDSLEF